MINLGLIGAGKIACEVYGPLLNKIDGVTLWSVLSRSRESGEKFANAFKAKSKSPVHTNKNDFFDDNDLNGVIICAPDRLHYQFIQKSYEKRKHVLCEKPIVVNINHLIGIEKMLGNDTGQVFGVCLQHRFHSGIRLLRKEIIENGAIGRVHYMRVSWINVANNNNWRAFRRLSDMWSSVAMGPHCFDLVRWFMTPFHGEALEIKKSVGSPHWKAENDELSSTTTKYSSGAIAEVFTSVIGQNQSSIEIIGENGVARAENILGAHGGGKVYLDGKELTYQIEDPFELMLLNFLEAIQGAAQFECNLNIAAANVRDILRT